MSIIRNSIWAVFYNSMMWRVTGLHNIHANSSYQQPEVVKRVI
jgi:hypothetical protein